MRRGIPFPASSFAPLRTRNGIQSRRGKRRENDESIESAQQCSTNSQRTSTGLLAACPHRANGGSAAGAWPADCDLGQSDSRSPGCPRRRRQGPCRVRAARRQRGRATGHADEPNGHSIPPRRSSRGSTGRCSSPRPRPSWTKSRWRRSPRRRRSRSTSI